MSRQVTVTYKTNPQTGQPFRPPFETTEVNIEDHEKLFSNIIKDIKFSGGNELLNLKGVAPSVKMGGVPVNHADQLREKDALIESQAEAIKKMNDEIDVLKRQLSDSYKRPVIPDKNKS